MVDIECIRLTINIKTYFFWRKIGIDEEAPLVHLLFLIVSTIMLSFVYLIGNVGVALVGA